MKRRSLPKTNKDGPSVSRRGPIWRGDESTVKLRAPMKKVVKKKSSKSAASSILGLKKQTMLSSDCDTKSSGDDMHTIDHVAECQRLREQLERVLVDHQRQEEEVVALRALAKALKEEVEAIHERQQLKSCMNSDSDVRGGSRFGSHEFYKLDVHLEQLQSENDELRRLLEISQGEAKYARVCVAQKLPTYKLAAVKANAELRCVKSQLQQERAHSDRLQEQLVRYKARRDDVPARVFPDRGNNQEQEGDINIQESAHVQREREKFLRQCKRLQESKALRSEQPGTPTGSTDIEDIFQTSKARQVHPVSASDFSPSINSTPSKPNGLTHDNYVKLNFESHKLSLSPITSPTSSKSI